MTPSFVARSVGLWQYHKTGKNAQRVELGKGGDGRTYVGVADIRAFDGVQCSALVGLGLIDRITLTWTCTRTVKNGVDCPVAH